MTAIVSKPQHGTPIGYVGGDLDKPIFPSPMMLLYMDDLTSKLNAFLLGEVVGLTSYTVAGLPTVPGINRPGLIYVSDAIGGPVPAFSDGINWRRVTDKAIVS